MAGGILTDDDAILIQMAVTGQITGVAGSGSQVIQTGSEEQLQAVMLTDSVFQPLLTALIGLLPNCAPSVILAELYLAGAIDLASVVAGLCTGAGVGLLVLFRVNRGLKENLGIAALLYGIGAAAGLVIQLVQFAF